MEIHISDSTSNECISWGKAIYLFAVWKWFVAQGFSKLVPLHLIKVFDEKELEVSV